MSNVYTVTFKKSNGVIFDKTFIANSMEQVVKHGVRYMKKCYLVERIVNVSENLVVDVHYKS